MTSNDYFSELLSDLCFTTAEDIINLCLTAKIYKQLLLRMGSAFYGIALQEEKVRELIKWYMDTYGVNKNQAVRDIESVMLHISHK